MAAGNAGESAIRPTSTHPEVLPRPVSDLNGCRLLLVGHFRINRSAWQTATSRRSDPSATLPRTPANRDPPAGGTSLLARLKRHQALQSLVRSPMGAKGLSAPTPRPILRFIQYISSPSNSSSWPPLSTSFYGRNL
jgi:hypothetical protein